MSKQMDLDERIDKLSNNWVSQGRDEEHIWAVRNFLTGAGKTDILTLIRDVIAAVKPERKYGSNEYCEGFNEAITEIEANTKRLVGE